MPCRPSRLVPSLRCHPSLPLTPYSLIHIPLYPLPTSPCPLPLFPPLSLSPSSVPPLHLRAGLDAGQWGSILYLGIVTTAITTIGETKALASVSSGEVCHSVCVCVCVCVGGGEIPIPNPHPSPLTPHPSPPPLTPHSPPLTCALQASLLLTTEPVWAAFFGYLLLAETLGPPQILGGASILAVCIRSHTYTYTQISRSLSYLP
jgi:hypothetical protein